MPVGSRREACPAVGLAADEVRTGRCGALVRSRPGIAVPVWGNATRRCEQQVGTHEDDEPKQDPDADLARPQIAACVRCAKLAGSSASLVSSGDADCAFVDDVTGTCWTSSTGWAAVERCCRGPGRATLLDHGLVKCSWWPAASTNSLQLLITCLGMHRSDSNLGQSRKDR